MTLMMTSAQVVETSVNVTNNSPSRDYSHPDDQTTQTTETPGFKPFTVLSDLCNQYFCLVLVYTGMKTVINDKTVDFLTV